MEKAFGDVPARYMGMGMLRMAIEASKMGFTEKEWLDMCEQVWESLQYYTDQDLDEQEEDL